MREPAIRAGDFRSAGFRFAAALAIGAMLSACATHPATRAPITQPTAATSTNASAISIATPPPPVAPACPDGDGVVVRVVPIDATGRNANVDLMQGGVVGGVLGDGKDAGNPQGAGAANAAIARYDLYVKLDSGEKIILDQRDAVGIVVGSRVRVAACRANPLQ